MQKFGHPCVFLSEVNSTNNYVANHPNLDELSDGTAILAHNQTIGRGQRGNSWQMTPGKDIAVSYLIRPKMKFSESFYLNKAIALAVKATVNEFSDSKVNVKWPNDIFLNDKKIAGLLIEPHWAGQECKHVIVGIGLNINSSKLELPQGAISLLNDTGVAYEISSVFNALNLALEKEYWRFELNHFDKVNDEYNQSLLGLNEEIGIGEGESLSIGKIQGVNSQGQLQVLTPTGIRNITHGQHRISYSGIV